MGWIFFIVVVVLVATVGFWDTLGAILGGAAILALIVIVLLGLAVWSGYRAFIRNRHSR